VEFRSLQQKVTFQAQGANAKLQIASNNITGPTGKWLREGLLMYTALTLPHFEFSVLLSLQQSSFKGHSRS
jgi:hypothetical protein